MPSWSNIITVELSVKEDLLALAKIGDNKQRLFEDFQPKAGGQRKFFDLAQWESIQPQPWRWAALIGGIGCIAGETEINGVPVKELTLFPIKVQTLMGEAWATPAFVKGQANLYRVTLRSGKQVVVTKSHNFLGLKGWCPLKSLHVGDVLACYGTQYEKNLLENTINLQVSNPNILSMHDSSYWDVIEAIEYVRYDDFYDLHVPIDNHYLAHGIWHHNSGKSYCGAAWACSRALLDPKSRGMISANSYGQLARATLIALVEVCRAYNVPLSPWRDLVEDQALAIANHQRCYIGDEKAFVYVISATSFTGRSQTGRGLQIRWAWGDEFAYAPEQAFLTLDGRLGRGPGILKGQGILTTSPTGYTYLWDKFGDPTRSDQMKILYQMQQVSSLENADHLGDDYVQSLSANYTEELYQQEVMGLFVNTVTGLTYKYFQRSLHTLSKDEAEIIDYDPHLPLMLSFDFNATPCVAIAAQRRANEVHFFKEWFLLDADLWELAELIAEWIEKAGIPPQIELYGDATGRARNAHSRLTSWDIIYEGLRQVAVQTITGKLIRRFDDSNPHVVNRVHSVNLAFRSDRCFIHFDRCQNLIKDLEQVTWDEGQIKKSDNPLLTHLSDAFGYLIHYLYPFRPKIKVGMSKKRPIGLLA